MPAYKQETIEYHKEQVRRVMALNPLASGREIREQLARQKVPLNLAPAYLAKLMRKVRGERIHRFDQARVDERLAELQERTEVVINKMLGILFESQNPNTRIGAARVILDADYRFFEAQLNAGVFERKLGMLEVEHRHGLSPELGLPILRALANYRIIDSPSNGYARSIDSIEQRASASANASEPVGLVPAVSAALS